MFYGNRYKLESGFLFLWSLPSVPFSFTKSANQVSFLSTDWGKCCGRRKGERWGGGYQCQSGHHLDGIVGSYAYFLPWNEESKGATIPLPQTIRSRSEEMSSKKRKCPTTPNIPNGPCLHNAAVHLEILTGCLRMQMSFHFMENVCSATKL